MKITDIQLAVCEEFEITLKEMLSQSRERRLAWPRHVAMGISREMMSLSLVQIKKGFKRKNHTTIMHAVENYKKLLEDADWASRIYKIEKRLR